MNKARENGCEYIDITSGEIYRNVEGHPGKNHNRTTCCCVMYSMKKNENQILEPLSNGEGAKLTIRYKF